jgi:hypothetical protein
VSRVDYELRPGTAAFEILSESIVEVHHVVASIVECHCKRFEVLGFQLSVRDLFCLVNPVDGDLVHPHSQERDTVDHLPDGSQSQRISRRPLQNQRYAWARRTLRWAREGDLLIRNR